MGVRTHIPAREASARAVLCAARSLTLGDVRRIVGPAVYRTLTPRQKQNLRMKLEVLSAWRAYCHVCRVKHGNTGILKREFAVSASAGWGTRVTPGTLDRWLERARLGGAEALVDYRGRPRGSRRPVDARLLALFGELLAGGETIAAAHRVVRKTADQTGRAWPRGVRTVERWFEDGQVVVERAPRKRRTMRRDEYLVRGVGLN